MQHSYRNNSGIDNEIDESSHLSELDQDLLEHQNEVPPEQHFDTNDNGPDNGFNVLLEHQDEILLQQFKTITIEEYKKLMQLMLQVKKNEDTIKQMEAKIELKDAQIKKLRISLDEKQSIRVDHLSNVSELKWNLNETLGKHIRSHHTLF